MKLVHAKARAACLRPAIGNMNLLVGRLFDELTKVEASCLLLRRGKRAGRLRGRECGMEIYLSRRIMSIESRGFRSSRRLASVAATVLSVALIPCSFLHALGKAQN